MEGQGPCEWVVSLPICLLKNHTVLGGSIQPRPRLVACTCRLGDKSDHDGINW